MKYPSFLIATALLCAVASHVHAQAFLQERDSFKLTEWRFNKGDINGADAGAPIDESRWAEVKVPHTWNDRDVLSEGEHYYQGTGWYRTSFTTNGDIENRRWFIRFEGASSTAEVYLNNVHLGTHKGGYSAFCYELTPCLNDDGKNYLSVKVNNENNRDVAPSNTSLYPIFGGIYRPVTVFSTPESCVYPLDYASSGIYVHPVHVTKENALLDVELLLSRKHVPSPKNNVSEIKTADGKDGLEGRYYANNNFAGPAAHIRNDSGIEFDYKLGAPFDDFENDGFSAIWTGKFTPANTGRYRFYLSSDDGSRLTIDDKLLIDNWGQHPAGDITGDIDLEAGKSLPIKVEYYEDGGDASISLRWALLPDAAVPVVATLLVELLDAEGSIVSSERRDVRLPDDTVNSERVQLSVETPTLWDGVRNPYLYTLRVSLNNQATGSCDIVEQPVGLRSFRVDTEEGLILNGEYYDLHGVSRHQESEGFGPALSDEQHRQDFEQMKELGCSGLRLAHYQQAELMYSLSDMAGMVVWAEIPNTPAYRTGNKAYIDNTRQQLTELIKQNYNHPSILFWGMYNEIPIPVEDLEALNDIAHTLDPSRLTTCADLSDPCERNGVTDLVGWNKYFGWYYGAFNDYAAWFANYRALFPHIPAGLSEYGAGGCVTQHEIPPRRPDAWNGKFYPEEYQSFYHEEVWRGIKDRHDIWCKFIWNMYDFSWTGVHRGDRPYINQKGLVTHDRKTRKDSFYFYKANWSSEAVLHICSKRFSTRHEAETPVIVYSNLDSVELFLNGKRIGEARTPDDIHRIEWSGVTLQAGRNQVGIVGRKDGLTYTDSCVWEYQP
ncbi:MAG: DUF4982 domain-containing protein [Opitutales bacterium]|nr:DUF4982 domain-containing protein [Opitutales bacterium]